MFRNGILTRCLLMDIPRLLGVGYLEGGRPIYPEDLETWERKAGIKVESGDAVLIRTGPMGAAPAGGALGHHEGLGGPARLVPPLAEEP